MVKSYVTIARDAEAEIVVKRSRFLCLIRRVETEAAAREVVAEARYDHWSARHHCSAFVVGHDRALRRSNDDGEPAGTAGAPMLQALDGREVSDVVAVVVRYFGGTLLGAGGLIRSYSDAVDAGLAESGLLTRRLTYIAAVKAPMADAGRLDNWLRSATDVRSVGYGEFVQFVVATDDVPALALAVAQRTGGAGSVVPLGSDWVDC